MNVRKIDTFSGHRDCVYTLISDGSQHAFYSAGGDGLVVRWDICKPDLGELIARVPSSIYSLAHDPSTGLLWLGQNYEGIQIVDPLLKKPVASMHIGTAPIFDLKLWQDKALVALGDGVVVVIDVPSFAIQKYLKVSHKSARAIAIYETSGEMAVGYSDCTVGIFDLDTLSLKKRFQAHGNSVFSVQYSLDGSYLLTGGRDAHLKAWDVVHDYSLAQDIPAHMFAINHLIYRPDGKLLATASMDKSIKLWDAESLRLVKVLDRARHAGHSTSINKLLWVGNKLVSASDDRSVALWEIDY